MIERRCEGRRPRDGRWPAWSRVALVASVALAGAAGCDATPKQQAAPAPEAQRTAATASAAPVKTATPAPSASVVAVLPNLTPSKWDPPETPSKPPTVAEWAAASEIEVKNAKRLGCEVKSAREWLRVSCRTTEDSASQIKELRWIEPSAKLPDFYDMTKPGTLASIVFPIRRQTKARVEFVWSDFARVLTVAWTPGTPQPLVYFSGDAPKDLSKPLCTAVCGNPYFPGRGTMPCPSTHDPTNPDADNGCICRKFRDNECTSDW
ncbi:Hypothetical protein A7982_05792 [Minicystis rosea]|nr:Hypothetical protein A7982_05792 [Minicystis rosea]